MNPASLPRCKNLSGVKLAGKFKEGVLALLNLTTWFGIPCSTSEKAAKNIFRMKQPRLRHNLGTIF